MKAEKKVKLPATAKKAAAPPFNPWRRLEEWVGAGEVDTVVTAFPDLYGRLVGKRNTARFFLESVARHGMHACDYLLGCDVEMDPVPGYSFTNWESGYGDFRCVPDARTLRKIPWLPKSALVICDLLGEERDEPVAVSPRAILQKQVDRARNAGFLPMGASELEFYLFKESFESAKRKHFHDLDTYGWYIEDYHLLQGTKEEPFIRAVRNGMEAAGVPIESSKGEWGPGQHEINVEYCDFLEMADRHVIFKHGCKEIASQMGLAVTFMAKWNEKLAGSSCHMHSSLWDTSGKSSKFADDADPNGMSATFRHYLAGLIAHARELAIFFAPYVNSYKRYQAGSFAPTRIVWSPDNRTAGFRVLGHGNAARVENRSPGADANPYLAFAATLAAGLDGIEKKLPLGPRFDGNAYTTPGLPTLPASLAEATAELERSSFAREAFGVEVVEHYLHMAKTELRKFNEVVTCWERERHFERT